MRPRGTAVRFELGDQIDVEESAATTPQPVTACECHMRATPIDYDASRSSIASEPRSPEAQQIVTLSPLPIY